MKKIFIDGKEGTTGLKIFDRLAEIDDIEVITLSEENRKNPKYRKEALNSCDIAFLCLPDAASIEAVSMVENENVTIIDTSTAHRTNKDWAYGFPELSKETFDAIKTSKRIAVPGCHASGFIALVYPLIKAGVIGKDAKLSCHSITGYSGGGKKMIAEYEGAKKSPELFSPRQYGISQQHKHLKEMVEITGLKTAPIFCPIVDDYYSGMLVTVTLFKSDLLKDSTADDIKKIYKGTYNSSIVSFIDNISDDGFIASNALTGKDNMQISVCGNDEQILLVARFDNLGKGASGAAIECMNIKMGLNPEKNLNF